MSESNRHQQHTQLVRPIKLESVPKLKGLVLAGGESKRMGLDKGSIDYYGMPHREYLVQLLNHFVTETFLSCRPGHAPHSDTSILEDTFLDLGPYGGVLTAFRHDPNAAWLAVACDIPLLDEEMIQQLIDQRDLAKIATCFHDPSTGFPEPLITIWEPKAYPVLLQFLGQGISCLRKALINTDSKMLQTNRPDIMKNANTPEEVANMQKLLHGSHSHHHKSQIKK